MMKVTTGLSPSRSCKGKIRFKLSPWFVDGHVLPVTSQDLFCVCVSVSKCPLLIRIPVTQTWSPSEALKLELQHMHWGGWSTQVSP